MAIPASLQSALDQIDQDTNAVAAVVTSLRDLISTSMSQADVDTVKGKLEEISARLVATAADPTNPIPPGPPPTPA